ncbi:MAG: IPT/TIG domain-containing protein [Actinomycetota bacterium]
MCGVLALVSALVGATAVPADAATFSNTESITIPNQGQAGVYPSSITVSGLSGTVVDVNATLTGYSHSIPRDVDVLLVGPLGQDVVLMADTGGSPSVTNINLTFDDAAAGLMPNGVAVDTSGTYKPSNAGAFDGTPSAPAGPYGAQLSVFDGTNPNGSWKLYVYDDTLGAAGSISGGWSLDIATNGPTITAFTPTTGTVGTSVVITGTNFTGATRVDFVNASTTAFTVDSATQITVAVPPSARTGPISIATPGGTVESATDFVVQHPRKVTLDVRGKTATGTLHVTDGFSACASRVPVRLQHLRHRHWRTVVTVLTGANGTYSAPGLGAPGKYRAVAKHATLRSGDVCLKDVSPVEERARA